MDLINRPVSLMFCKDALNERRIAHKRIRALRRDTELVDQFYPDCCKFGISPSGSSYRWLERALYPEAKLLTVTMDSV